MGRAGGAMLTETAIWAEAVEDSMVISTASENRAVANTNVARRNMPQSREFKDLVSVEMLNDCNERQMLEIGISVSPREAPGLARGSKQSRTATNHTRQQTRRRCPKFCSNAGTLW